MVLIKFYQPVINEIFLDKVVFKLWKNLKIFEINLIFLNKFLLDEKSMHA